MKQEEKNRLLKESEIGVWIDNDKDVFSSYGLYRFKLISEVRSEVIEDILS